jgi:hypothetical protein
MKDALVANRMFGPWMIYTSNDWDRYLDKDYILTGGNVTTQTLRARLKQIEGVQDVRRLDFLDSASFPFTFIMVQLGGDDAPRAINGMDVTMLQWPDKSGLKTSFKVMCIYVPQMIADFYGRCGILEAQAV